MGTNWKKRRLAVIYGGPSSERVISLRTSAAVRKGLRRLGAAAVALEVSARLPEQLRRNKINLAFLATHGTVGEDGRLQGMLDVLGIPYTGSGVRASALAMHKPTAKRLFDSAGLPTPRWGLARREERSELFSSGTVRRAYRILEGWKLPVVIKPASQGSAVGVTVAKTVGEFRRGLTAAWRAETEALIEEYVPGPEITVGLLGDRILPVVEIVPAHGYYDYHSKYAPGGSKHIVPARLPAPVLRRAQELAAAAFHVLGCRHVARVDLLVGRAGPTLLEVNTLPGLTPVSLLPDAARAAGLSFVDLIDALLRLAEGDRRS